MNRSFGRACRWFLAPIVLGLSAPMASAYPDKPISLIVPFAPGGSSDNVARTIGPALAEKLGQSFVIDNVSGAGGVLGTQKAVRANPDGYTILLGSGSEILINKLINPKLPYDGTKDLAPVAMVGPAANGTGWCRRSAHALPVVDRCPRLRPHLSPVRDIGPSACRTSLRTAHADPLADCGTRRQLNPRDDEDDGVRSRPCQDCCRPGGAPHGHGDTSSRGKHGPCSMA